MIWFISDTHFGHGNIIRYCNRPFQTVEEMNKEMIHRWNEKVDANDVVWHLGDFALCKKSEIERLLLQLHGKIRLIKGNHDTRSNKVYRELGFAEVYDHPIILDEFIVLSHEPMPFVPSTGMINLYGHVHDSLMHETWGKQCACLCVERHNYSPVSMKEISEHFK